jgi:hypothetical protein
VRRAEYVMAGVMAFFSLYLMWKSAELPIGWEPRKGPGGGAFPFWLSLGMLICCGFIAFRNFRGVTPESRSTESFMDRVSFKLFLTSAGSLTVFFNDTATTEIYTVLPLFFIFYIRFVGRHSWATTGALAIGVPVVTFFFFEIGLKILLPKGFTEPLFYPLYEIFL